MNTLWNPCCESCTISCTDTYYDEKSGLCKSTFIFGGSYEPYKKCFEKGDTNETNNN